MEYDRKKINNIYDSCIAHMSFQTPNFQRQYFEKKNLTISREKEINISILVICRNEERCILRCLQSIQKQIQKNDEIIVIDTGSTDQTINIIKREAPLAKIKEMVWKDDFAYARNTGIELAINDWIFFVDADEYLKEKSLDNLRNVLELLDGFEKPNFAICPTIINSNNHVVNGVRRVINRKSKIRFWGYVHEELRYNKEKMGYDVEAASFDNIVLFHDGYEKEIIKFKEKTQRNIQLLLKMVEREPKHPRWTYFLARDGKQSLSNTEYEKLLIETVKLCDENNYFEYYDVRALSDLTNYYISFGQIDMAEKVLNELKVRAPHLSDVFYFRTYIDFCQLKEQTLKLLVEACKYREKCKKIEYGSIHAQYFHIDFLIAKLFFEVGEYEKSTNILKRLKSEKYFADDKYYLVLYRAIENYLEN